MRMKNRSFNVNGSRQYWCMHGGKSARTKRQNARERERDRKNQLNCVHRSFYLVFNFDWNFTHAFIQWRAKWTLGSSRWQWTLHGWWKPWTHTGPIAIATCSFCVWTQWHFNNWTWRSLSMQVTVLLRLKYLMYWPFLWHDFGFFVIESNQIESNSTSITKLNANFHNMLLKTKPKIDEQSETEWKRKFRALKLFSNCKNLCGNFPTTDEYELAK